jgi:hypothetical protein
MDVEAKLGWHMLDLRDELPSSSPNLQDTHPRYWWSMEKLPEDALVLGEVSTVSEVIPLIKLAELIG